MNEESILHFQSNTNLINATLDEYLSIYDADYQVVADAMKYSVEIGGKRLRPLLALEFCEMCGGNISDVLPFACAIEMIHTYSLIHDDLPAMDNDDYRRGKESCHKKFGEANAILAGDALLTYAFQVAADGGANPAMTVKCVRALANFAGIYGMVGGQTMDIANEDNSDLDIDTIRRTHKLKTGALIRAACEIGCSCAVATSEQYEAARAYAENLGLAFQIEDDILDVVGDANVLGKEIGQDAENGKVTYVTLLGIDGARALADDYTRQALAAIEKLPGSEKLQELTKNLLERKS